MKKLRPRAPWSGPIGGGKPREGFRREKEPYPGTAQAASAGSSFTLNQGLPRPSRSRGRRGGTGRFAARDLSSEVMFDGSFEQATILRTGPGGLTRVVTRSSCDRRESILVEGYAAELIVLRRWEEFHRKALGVGRRMPARQEFGAPARQGSCDHVVRPLKMCPLVTECFELVRRPSRTAPFRSGGHTMGVFIVTTPVSALRAPGASPRLSSRSSRATSH
jgi:hypothetical protein